MTVVRILIWNLADSKTTLDELREQLPELDEGDAWIGNEHQERREGTEGFHQVGESEA